MKETQEQLIVNWTIRRANALQEMRNNPHQVYKGELLAESETYQRCVDELARIIPIKVSDVCEDVVKIRQDERRKCIDTIREFSRGYGHARHPQHDAVMRAADILAKEMHWIIPPNEPDKISHDGSEDIRRGERQLCIRQVREQAKRQGEEAGRIGPLTAMADILAKETLDTQKATEPGGE